MATLWMPIKPASKFGHAWSLILANLPVPVWHKLAEFGSFSIAKFGSFVDSQKMSNFGNFGQQEV